MIGLILSGFSLAQLNAQLPNAQSIRDIELKVPLRVYSADGLLISEFGDERRKPIEYNDFPKALINAVLASEDDHFFKHNGIDFSGLIRAALSNFLSGQTQQGASTITMQVARNFFLSPEKTYLRKVREIILAIRIEQILSKEEILSLYLNKIFLGHRAYGFGAAAQVYYDKELSELSIAEIAMLAGLPKAPSRYNPLSNVERAVIRRNYVLGRMHELDKISDSVYAIAKNSPATARKHERTAGLAAPHIAEMVRSSLTQAFGEQAYWQGLNVYTTIQSKQQIAAQSALRKGLKAYDKRHGFRGPIARLKLDTLELDRELGGIDYDKALSIYPNSQEQRPALITEIAEFDAVAQTRSYGEVTLTLDNARWAKRHRTANIVGDPPKQMSDILSVGDVVYIEPIIEIAGGADSQSTTAEQTQSENNTAEADDPAIVGWRLSQIPNVSGALISMDPNSGRIISLVGGYDFFLNKYNRAVQSIRQPGSNIKPFIYSASLDKGFTPATLISGAPIVTRDPVHGTLWRPENYSGKFFGPTRMREALSKSLNLVSIRLLRSIGIPFSREYISRFGIDMERFAPTLTMALGAGGATPLQVVNAYSTLANGGYQIEPQFIDYIEDRNGKLIYRHKQPRKCDECYAQYLPKLEEPEIDESFASDDGFINEDGLLLDTLDETAKNNLSVDTAEVSSDPLQEQPAERPALDSETNKTAAQALERTADDPSFINTEQEGLTEDQSTPLTQSEILSATLSTSGLLLQSPSQDADPNYYTAPRVMNSANNFLTVSMLRDVVRYGTARKALKLNRQDLAGKTGTTNDYIDAWFSGFNSKIATTVWVGFDNPATMGRGEAGSRAALPIWIDYMRTGLEGIPEDPLQIPAFIEQAYVDKVTGKRSSEVDPNAIPEYFAITEFVPEFMSVEAKEALAREQEIAQQAIEAFNLLSPEEQAEQLAEEAQLLEIELKEKLARETLQQRSSPIEPYGQAPFDPRLDSTESRYTPPTNNGATDPELGDPEPLLPVDPNERVIENQQDTEGLF